jgi:hypothetical protein
LNRKKLILIAAATGGDRHDEEYEKLRQAVMDYKPLERQLPSFVRVCKTLEEFWSYIKSEYRTYPERRHFIIASLDPALNLLEKKDELSAKAGARIPYQKPSAQQEVACDVDNHKDSHPRGFISYTESDGDLVWIVSLAEKLTKNGVDVRLYEWEKHERLNLPGYMEKDISESDYILIICSPAYAQKANKREAGVGYETTIITGDIYRHSMHSKIIPILRKGDPTSSVPTYAQTMNRIDMRDDGKFDEKFEDLLRAIYKIPRYAKPEVGERPNLESKSSESWQSDARDASAAHTALPESGSSDQQQGIRKTTDSPKSAPNRVDMAILTEQNTRFKRDALDDKWVVRRSTRGSPVILINIIPEGIASQQKRYDFDAKLVKSYLQPLGSSSWNTRITKDGVLSTSPTDNNSSVLLRWDGTIEVLDERFMALPEMKSQNQYNLKLLSLVNLGDIILARVGKYIAAMKLAGVDFPVDIFMTLDRVRDFCAVELGYDTRESPILSDSIDLETCSVASDGDLKTALLPAFDSLARSCGLQRFEYAKR